MKKLLVIVAISTMMLAGLSLTANAGPASTSTSVPLSFTVPAAFGFTLDKYSYDFGTINAGVGGQTTIGIFCKSNHGIVWKLALKADPFSNGTDTIPSDPGFKCAAWSNDGVEKAQGTFATFPLIVPTAQTDFYTSTLAEGSDPFVPLVLGLYVTVPDAQGSGLYNTNLVLTMYE